MNEEKIKQNAERTRCFWSTLGLHRKESIMVIKELIKKLQIKKEELYSICVHSVFNLILCGV